MSNAEGPHATLASVPEPLRGALVRRGFTALTAVQAAVLEPALAGRDLRISSETGSGKTVAIGFVVAPTLPVGATRPRALVVAPTRELAAQVRGELAWLFEDLGVRVVAVTGGTDARAERRELHRGAAVVVGTPGRLLDHLDRGAIDVSEVASAVLDEADQMLDLGFRDDLEAILAKLPATRATHLVSATFPREVVALADRFQRNPVPVQGTRLGDANVAIKHVVHVVREDQRFDALVNLLLDDPDARTLIFVRTRRDTADLTERLVAEGIRTAAMSGDMEQDERTRTLDSFREGTEGSGLRVLVATDVAARGLDVADIGRVIHADPPNDSDTYTHRSGRTGRAGKKGLSVTLATPASRARVVSILRRARVEATFAPVPTEKDLLARADERLLASMTTATPTPTTPRLRGLAARLLAELSAEDLAVRLLGVAMAAQGPQPRKIDALAILEPDRTRRPTGPELRADRGDRADRADRPDRPAVRRPAGDYVTFRVTWGAKHGADPRRLLALVCRRGKVAGQAVGTMKVGPVSSTVDIAAEVAEAFAIAAAAPDARDARVRIARDESGGPPPPQRDVRPRAPAPRSRPPSDRGGEAPLRRPRSP